MLAQAPILSARTGIAGIGAVLFLVLASRGYKKGYTANASPEVCRPSKFSPEPVTT